MKVLYFDCYYGISTDKILASLIDLVDDFSIEKLNIKVEKIKQNQKEGTMIKEINDFIDINKLNVSETIKQHYFNIQNKLSLLKIKPNQYSNMNILTSLILIDTIKPDKIITSPIRNGNYTNLYNILSNTHIITKQIDIDEQLITPISSIFIDEITDSYELLPAMNIKKVGVGFGKKQLQVSNEISVILGNTAESKDIVVMETNIDDCSSEILGYTMERLLDNHALDVFFTPIFMKKNRPAYRLTVVCDDNYKELLKDIIFKETTTIGIRYRYENRFVLDRKIIEKQTEYGIVHIKRCIHHNEVYEYVEFEDVKKIAKENNLAIKEVYKKVME